jgi:GR25 family glycosyltransferase involved in LPS biosynthesis
MKLSKCSEMSLVKNAILVILLVSFIFHIFFSIKEGFEEKAKKYLDGVDIIYWINLDRSEDRKADMEEMFKDEAFVNIPNKRIKAFDGKTETKTVFNKLQINSKTQSNAEYACLLSHLESIREFNESSYNIALIFEDDATLEFKKYWNKSIKEIMKNAPPDWDIILLTYIYGVNKLNTSNTSWDNSPMYDRVFSGNYSSSLSYVINKNGSTKILNNYKNGKYNLSLKYTNVADVYLYNLTNTYAYKYPYFIYKTENDSTIHPDHISYHNASKKKIIDNYTKMTNDK